LNKIKILVVDEDKDTLNIVDDILVKKYELSQVVDSASTLHILSSKNKPNLILLDVNMLKTNGYELIKTIKSNPLTSEIPIVSMISDNNDVHKSFENIASDGVLNHFY